MKKFFMFAMAAVAMLSVSSCLSEEEVNLTRGQENGVGYIRINATTDGVAATRAVTGPGNSYSTWYATVQDKDNNYKWPTSGESTFTAISDALNTVAIPAGNCTVNVRNFTNLAAALDQAPLSGSDDNTKYGAPYWEGSETETVAAGTVATPITVECGTPQNAKLTVAQSDFVGTNMASNVVVHLTDATYSRNIDFTYSGSAFNNGGVAYFAAEQGVRFYITYDYGEETGLRWPASDANPNYSTVTMGDRGTSNLLTIRSNGNGQISLTITTSDFTAATEETTTLVTFDALDGSKI